MVREPPIGGIRSGRLSLFVYPKFGESASFRKRSGLQNRFPGVRIPPPALNVAQISTATCSLTTPQRSRHNTLARGRPCGRTAEHHPVTSTLARTLTRGPPPVPVADGTLTGTGDLTTSQADAADGQAAALSLRRTGFDSRIGCHAPVAQVEQSAPLRTARSQVRVLVGVQVPRRPRSPTAEATRSDRVQSRFKSWWGHRTAIPGWCSSVARRILNPFAQVRVLDREREHHPRCPLVQIGMDTGF